MAFQELSDKFIEVGIKSLELFMEWLRFGTVIKLDCFTDCFSNDDDEIKLSSNHRSLCYNAILFLRCQVVRHNFNDFDLTLIYQWFGCQD